MTIFEALNWGREQIKSTLDEKITQGHNPMLDAQVLLAKAIQKPTSYLFAHFEDEITNAQADKFQSFIDRRKQHEPVAYITGEKEFYKRKFSVNKFVLIPRPDTELMVESALKLIDEYTTIIDVGTGSGAIAVTLAAEKQQPVVAIDIDPQALAVARRNAEAHNAEKYLSFLEGDLLQPYFDKNIHETQSTQAVITANLPYIRIQQWPTLDPDVHVFEPKRALVGGVDGLELYDRLLQQIYDNRDKLPSIVYLMLEIDPSQEISCPRLVKEHFPEAEVQKQRDLSGKPRLIMAKL